ALVAGQVRGNAAGVTGALDVVLASERRDAAAMEAHLARYQREVQERVGVVNTVGVLGDAHAPDEARAREGRTRVPAGRLRDVLGRNAGDARGVVRRKKRRAAAPARAH